MNDDAEAWIAHYQSVREPGYPVDEQAMRAAMLWAYADAAKVIRNQQIGEFHDEYQGLDCNRPLAKLIEARAK